MTTIELPATMYNVINIPLATIHPSPLNRDTTNDTEGISELAASIMRDGLIHPISLRPMPDNPDKYEIVSGERRFLAFQYLRRDAIPAIIKNLTDVEAQLERIAENHHRRNLTPIEDGQAVKVMLELLDGDVKEVAARLGESETWVRRRAKLPNLHPVWLNEFKNIQSPYYHIGQSIVKMEELAVLPPETQVALHTRQVLTKCHTIAEMKARIAQFFRNLDRKPWTREYEKYHCSSKKRCDQCTKRSDREAVLFCDPNAVTSGKKMCLDSDCWDSKVRGYCAYCLKKDPSMIALTGGNWADFRLIQDYDGKLYMPSEYARVNEDPNSDGTYEGYGWIRSKGIYISGPCSCDIVDVWHKDKSVKLMESDDDDTDQPDEENDLAIDDPIQVSDIDPTRKSPEEVYNELVKELVNHFEHLEANTVLTPEEIGQAMLRASAWFGITPKHSSANEDDLLSSAWSPLAYIRQNVAAEVTVYVASVSTEAAFGDTHGEDPDFVLSVRNSVCDLFQIPIHEMLDRAMDIHPATEAPAIRMEKHPHEMIPFHGGDIGHAI